MEKIERTKKGSIILLENEESVRNGFKNLFEDLDINLDLVLCSSPKEYEKSLEEIKSENNLRGIVMDLSNTAEEEDTKDYKASQYIQSEFDTNRIPIFIHSGNLEHYDDLSDKGTVFKISKSSTSIEKICERIQNMNSSGFLDIFCLGGKLESKIMDEVHKAFVEQFKGNEIEEIIKSINLAGNNVERTTEVFERISLRTVFENWNRALQVDTGDIKEVRVNSIEHYYRRTSDFQFWTGDVFQNNKEKQNRCVILTPRCNVGHQKFDELLLCRIIQLDEEKIKELTGKKGEEKLRKNITDHKIVGERFRFLPPTPQFEGGMVDFKTVYTLKTKVLQKEFSRVITLSDELINDVVRKFAAYNLRGGISETEFAEAHYYVKSITESN